MKFKIGDVVKPKNKTHGHLRGEITEIGTYENKEVVFVVFDKLVTGYDSKNPSKEISTYSGWVEPQYLDLVEKADWEDIWGMGEE